MVERFAFDPPDMMCVSADDYDALEAEFHRSRDAMIGRIRALEAALRVAADLRESDIDGTDDFTFHWRSLIFGCVAAETLAPTPDREGEHG